MVSKQSWMWFSLLLFFLFSLKIRWTLGCLEQERFALLQLKPFFDSPYDLRNWVEGNHNTSDCCQWERVECNHTTGRVINIYLGYLRNTDLGEWYLNVSLFSPFQELQMLYFYENQIAGCVENEGFNKLSTLSNLEALYLDYNNFNNSILSSISRLSSLKSLDLSYNKLKGIDDLQGGNNFNSSILSSLGKLSSLKQLYIRGIGLKGTINFSELFDVLSNLEVLDVSNNQINKFVVKKGNTTNLWNLQYLVLGNVSINDGNALLQSLGSFPSLKGLDLSYNNCSGIMSNGGNTTNLWNLQYLFLRNVNIHDGNALWQSLGSFPSLKGLDLSYNNFSGIMSYGDLSNLKNLKLLYMDGTNLDTSILQSVGRLISLQTLSLWRCSFEGTFPSQDLSNLKNLTSLYMYGTNLEDTSILKSIGRLISLESLSLRNCSLRGTFPKQGLCELVHLQWLDLSDNELRGALPSCFANLTSLQALDISSNQFTGNISLSPLKSLTSIEVLTLSYNHFRIPISLEPFFNHSKLKTFICWNNDLYVEPELLSSAPKFQLNHIKLSGCKGSCTFPKFLYHQHDLQVVGLSRNSFTGEFPDWLLENNTNLVNLALANNSLIGPFHLPIHPQVILMTLDISMNMFNGHIPAEVGAYFPGLMILNISRNAFKGNIPSSIGDMSSLISLDLSNNQLSGGIPEHLANGCTMLKRLVLSNNALQGQIFSKTFNLRSLLSLQLDGNHFFGKILDSLSNSSFLQGLYLSDNQLSGQIPSWLGNMSSLIEIIMSNNTLEGPIPLEFCRLNHLEVLNLERNNITNIPSCFSPSSLRQVHLSRNVLKGELQYSFCNCSSLVTLDLGYNRITGSIPNWIGRQSNLTYLILNNNKLQGKVPIQLCQLDQLRLIDLSHNNFSGHIPPCLMTALHDRHYIMPNSESSYYDSITNRTIYPLVGKVEEIEFRTKAISYFYHGKILTNMSGIDLSCNKLTGEIPFQIGNLVMIHVLNLSHNNLTGPIPPTFSNLKQIESLDLSYNNLNGKIPHQLIELYTLEVFSVAYNNLSGKTLGMVAQFATFDERSYEGNPLLCGLPLPKSCDAIESPRRLQPASTDIGEENDFMDMVIFYISFTVSYAIVLLATIAVLFINPCWRQTWFYVIETLMTSVYYFIVDHFSKRFWR